MTEQQTKAAICPLCGGDNQCAMATGKDTCWCWNTSLDIEARARAAEITTEQCLCPACGKVKVERPHER